LEKQLEKEDKMRNYLNQQLKKKDKQLIVLTNDQWVVKKVIEKGQGSQRNSQGYPR